MEANKFSIIEYLEDLKISFQCANNNKIIIAYNNKVDMFLNFCANYSNIKIDFKANYLICKF